MGFLFSILYFVIFFFFFSLIFFYDFGVFFGVYVFQFCFCFLLKKICFCFVLFCFFIFLKFSFGDKLTSKNISFSFNISGFVFSIDQSAMSLLNLQVSKPSKSCCPMGSNSARYNQIPSFVSNVYSILCSSILYVTVFILDLH